MICGDTFNMQIERRHWLNTIVGILDAAFYLTYDEQTSVTTIVSGLLRKLDIPERGVAAVIPMNVAAEAFSNHYSESIAGSVQLAGVRQARRATPDMCNVSLEAWRAALENMFTSAYPDLSATERIFLAKMLTDLLKAIGVPYRASSFFPDAVIKMHRELSDTVPE